MPRRSAVFRSHKGEGKWVFLFLVLSCFINLSFLLLLSLFEFGGVPQPPKVVAVTQDLVEEIDRTDDLVRRTEVNLEKVASRNRRSGIRNFAEVQGDIEVMEADMPGLDGLDMDLSGAMAARLSEGWTLPRGKNTRKVRFGPSRQLEDVLDDMAKSILEVIERQRLLVVLLLDESRSLEDDREIMAAKLEYIFRDLQFAMTDRESRNLRWAVVSYGKTARQLLAPTDRMARVRVAIVRVRVDITGQENIIQALHFVDDKLGGVAPRKFVVCLTDEQGSDLEAEAVEAMIQRMKKSKTRFYVLGRESPFDRTTVYERDPETGIRAPVSRGLPTKGREVFGHYGHFVWSPSYPSGFGSYWLSAMAYHTNGRYFILSKEPSAYKAQVLERYRPEWCLPSEYDERNAKNELRAKMVEVLRQANRNMPRTHGYFRHENGIPEDVSDWSKQQDLFNAQAQKANEKIEWIDGNIEELRSLSGQRDSVKEAKYRWAANYDLMMGDLYRMKYAMIQIREVYEKAAGMSGMPKPNDRDQAPYIRYGIGHARRSKRTGKLMGSMLGGSEARRAMQHAQSAFSRVITSHEETPWAKRAAYSKQHWPILTMQFGSTRYGGGWGPYRPRL